ncbi:RHS repeat domain-containing protein [Pseudomonas sp. 10S4]|uniref:RHS repeat domain-containing protein n=1 Tax=Pseudomonas sp. 10S4 TaxID=3048583 RepID=UPI002AC8FBB2|nr:MULTISPECIES: RHS repeat-associated core domain-containing protein [unclassified Pseudomonas]MEB0226330.1 RHS repeat-associated core domain-containing protein [Pseudomonas sp. 5S1]MEB0297779.1 RHS repeat-associated core domain-containing protein [Pseudomonas sp. 10S4]WPX20849.1 RHS repeat-associated core domain-containing protein [Pseudomonas sp. 10S4]
MKNSQMSMHRNTPRLTAFDPRSLAVRSVDYHRDVFGDSTQARVNRTVYDAAGRGIGQWDPRQFQKASAPANVRSIHGLGGADLFTDSVDAGWRVGLVGEALLLLEQWDGRGTWRQTRYDDQLRPVSVFENGDSTEQLAYGDETLSGGNQCGRLIRHDDPAGVLLFNSYGLAGAVVEQERRFASESSPGFVSQSRLAPLGDVQSQIDAQGNEQRFSQTLDGQLRAVDLRLNNTTEWLPMVSAIHYNAHGQVEQEVAGNGVVTHLEYTAEDGRLKRLLSRLGLEEPLQDLRYAYDPVGNVLSIEDAALPTRYFANQRIEPINCYTYDSLSQLIEASGWEAGALKQGPLSEPTESLANYRQTYRYDDGNNLLELTHVGAQNPGHRLVAAAHSNRCLPVRDGVEPGEEDFRHGFDANGNLLNLQPGQALSWDLRNQLKEVRPVERDSGPDDSEHYVYGADGMRVRKIRSLQTNAQINLIETIYLPGLEVRTHSGTGEELHVINVQTGRGNVRVLHWEAERPPQIANNQQRYSLTDHLGSSTLELDQHANIITQERYYPFGGTAWSNGEAVQVSYKTVCYSGKERDATGLYYYGFRYYAPERQRWLNPDPGGVIDGLNLYGFVKNRPISLSDQNGLFGQSRYHRSDSTQAVAELIEIFNRPTEGQSRVYRGNEREVLGRRIEGLAALSQNLPGLMEYAEGGNGVSDQINFHLRGLSTSETEIKSIVENFKAEVKTLPDYQGVAYRALRVNAGVFGGTVKIGSIVADRGFMSASVVPHSVIGWLENWADHKAESTPGQQRVILVFDEQTPKKVAATGFLADHLLIEPLAQFKVSEIHHTGAVEAGNRLTVVGLQSAKDTSRHKIRDLRSGEVLLPAINPGWLSRVRSRLSPV